MLVYYSLLLASIIHLSTAEFKWATKKFDPRPPHMKHVNLYDDFYISCQTNDPNATVMLYFRSNPMSDLEPVVVRTKGRMKQKDQLFHVTGVKMKDAGLYICKAENSQGEKLTLDKGRLSVSPVVKDDPPEILPKNDVAIETDGDFTIKCQTKGDGPNGPSLLTWYRKLPNGKMERVDASKIRKDEITKPDKTVIIVLELKFTKFTSAEEGEYVCERKVTSAQGKTTITSDTRKVTKIPDEVPKVFANTSSMKPNEISPITLTCLATAGSPKPTLIWTINGKERKTCKKPHDSKCVLEIDQVKLDEDNGDFVCTATNIVGGDSKSVNIEVQVAPKLKPKNSDSVVARSHEAVELFCHVSRANPPPVITWFEQQCRSGSDKCNVIESAWRNVTKQDPSSSTRTTRSFIITPKVETTYWYRYVAKNPTGEDSFAFKLSRQDNFQHQFAIVSKNKDKDKGVLTVYENEEVTFECHVDSTVYKKQYLTKGAATLPSSEFKETDQGKTVIMEFTKSQSKLTDAGEYTCVAVSYGNVTRTREIQIKVIKLIAPSISGFNSISGFKDIKIVQDKKNPDYVITCNAAGSPPPLVTWRVNGIAIPINQTIANKEKCQQSTAGVYRLSFIVSGNQLAICKVDFTKHYGKYECNATNRVSSKIASLNLVIEASPEIVDWKSSFPVGLEQPANLTCRTIAKPAAKVTWYKKGKNKNNVVKTNTMESNLTFASVKRADDGIYICIAENVHGKMRKEMTLAVEGSIIADKTMIVGVVVAVIILFVLTIIYMCWYKRRLKIKYAPHLTPNINFKIDPDRSLFQQSSELPYNMAWEFPRGKLVFIKILGSGQFGEVWLAEASGIRAFKPRDTSKAATKRRKKVQKRNSYHCVAIKYKKHEDLEIDLELVAVKKIKDEGSAEDYKDLASELKIIIHLGEHENIVNLLGACTIDGDLNVVLEYCPHGNLLTFMRARRDVFQPVWEKQQADMEKEFTYVDLIQICHQVAKGMEFLQSRKCVHRDLAARNVLVGVDFVMKIGDFGLARDISNDDLYLKKKKAGLLPLKWMAPESLFDKLYTSMSDVWSYGILLWEVYTLGGSPYPGLPAEDLFAFLEDGKRNDRPDRCPKQMYEIMAECWNRSPYDRPNFGQIMERIANFLKQNVENYSDYIDYPDGTVQTPDGYLLAIDDKSNGAARIASKPEPKRNTFVPPTSSRGPHDYENQSLLPTCQVDTLPEAEDEHPISTDDDDYLNPIDTDYLSPVDGSPT